MCFLSGPACLLMLWGVLSTGTVGVGSTKIRDMDRALEFLTLQDQENARMFWRSSIAAWNYHTNLTEENRKASTAASLVESLYMQESSSNASLFDWENFQNATIRRRFASVVDIGTSALADKTKLERLSNLLSEMGETYSTGKVCLDGKCMELEPGLTRLMASSRDYQKLLDIWKGWRDATGAKIKDQYTEFVSLSNEAIKANNPDDADTGAYWRSWYESESFQSDVEKLWLQLRPFYVQLHAYTRRKLMEVYDHTYFPEEGHIPAHLLGNMWAQSWTNLLDILQPYKGKQSVDVTPQMKAQNYTVLRMFRTAESFFTSLGMKAMPDEFWNKSMFVRPDDGRAVVCHASAWDFYNQNDFRIKMCTDITMKDLITIHHEMGHIQYFLQYKDQPVVFRDGANPGFHEAIGDTLALSVSTPAHLHEIGLLDDVQVDNGTTINYLMKMALETVAFLPFGYLVDLWRWNVFSRKTTPDMYNTDWWSLRCKYQGISPPIARSEKDFDPGAKFHVPANTPYIRYFVSAVIQFQFHKALCTKANQTGPLHKCDIYRSTEAGNLLSRALQMGGSKPWPEVMRVLTGQDKMDAGALLEYFNPLIDWLKKENGDQKGWNLECPDHLPITSSTGRSAIFSWVAIVAAIFV